MSTITTIQSTDAISASRSTINTNFANLNTDKAELSGATFTGDINVPDEAYGVAWNGSTEVPTKNAIYDKIETMGGGGATTFLGLTDTPSSYVGQALKVVQVNAGATGLEFVTASGGGDALTANPLSQFASTTSAQLAGVISDETGSGSLVFATSPTLTTPNLGTPSALTLTNATGLPVAGITASTTQALGVGSIELGHATDTTISRVSAGRIAVEGVNVVTISSTDTLTNKDISSATNTYRSASDTVTGAVELATIAETTTGTDATRAVTPDGLAGSEFGKRTVGVLLSGSATGDTALATGDGLAAFPVDTTLNGMNLVSIKAYCTTVSSSGAPLFQVRRSRRSSATARTIVDMLTTGVSIDANEFESADATTAAVINTANDDVVTGDILLFDCDTAGTGTKGAQILLTFQLP